MNWFNQMGCIVMWTEELSLPTTSKIDWIASRVWQTLWNVGARFKLSRCEGRLAITRICLSLPKTRHLLFMTLYHVLYDGKTDRKCNTSDWRKKSRGKTSNWCKTHRAGLVFCPLTPAWSVGGCVGCDYWDHPEPRRIHHTRTLDWFPAK